MRNSWNARDALLPGALFIVLLLTTVRAFAGGATLAWDPVNSPALAGYVLHYGPSAGNYTSRIDVGNTTSRTISNLTEGATYHFAVTAYDALHTETGFSNDVSATIPYGAPSARFTASATSGVAPLAMNFVSTSTGRISTYAWTFGDGTTSTAKSPSHVYFVEGLYSVSLTVTGSGGSNTTTVRNYVSVTPARAPVNGINVALAANGGVATASSTNSVGFSAGNVIDNRRSGAGWGAGGGWNDATSGAFPDWIQVRFNGVRTIDRVVVYSVQDNYVNPIEPSDAMTFSLRGITDFLVQGFDGANWVTLATVSGNQLVKRSVTFAPYATDRIRIQITRALGNWSRVTEVEAWASTVSLTATNFALAVNGSVASSSSTNSAGFMPGTVIDNKRSGAGWGSGAGWNDATPGAFPDWIQVNFNGVRTIDRAVVYSVQDNYLNPAEPTDAMTFSLRGLTDFAVQGFDGANWVTLATVSGNRLVKRSVTFAPYATDRMRIQITHALASWSRVTEVELWGN